jgi:hypothetical protein
MITDESWAAIAEHAVLKVSQCFWKRLLFGQGKFFQ